MDCCPHCGAKPRKARKPAQVITTSAARCFRACPRKYQWRYVRGLQPRVEAEALRFGTLVHEGLAAWWLRRDWQIAAEADEFDAARARAQLAGYDARWTLGEYEVIAIEQPFEVPLIRGWRLAGKVDGLVRRNGSVYIIEHKTSSSDIGPGSDYMARLALDTQCSLYLMGVANHKPVGVTYDVLKKIALRPYQPGKKRETAETAAEYEARCIEAIAEAPEQYYQRSEVVRLDGELQEAKADLIATCAAIDACAKRGHFGRNDDACFSYGSRCQYFALCAHTGSEADYTKSDTQHPELKESN